MNAALAIPQCQQRLDMPIKARIDMLSTGIRTAHRRQGIRPDLGELDRLSKQIESVVHTVPGTTSAFASVSRRLLSPTSSRPRRPRAVWSDDHDMQGSRADRLWRRDGGPRRRGPRAVQRQRALSTGLRDDPQAIAQEVLVNGSDGTPPSPRPGRLDQALPRGRLRSAPRNAQLADYIYVDMHDPRHRQLCRRRAEAVQEQVTFPPGYPRRMERPVRISAEGQARLQMVVPFTSHHFHPAYLNFKRLTRR